MKYDGQQKYMAGNTLVIKGLAAHLVKFISFIYIASCHKSSLKGFLRWMDK